MLTPFVRDRQERRALRARVRELEEQNFEARRPEEQLRARVRQLEQELAGRSSSVEGTRRGERLRGSSLVRALVARSEASGGGALLRLCWAAWSFARRERALQAMLSWEARRADGGQQRHMRALSGWFGASTESLRRSSFAGWLHVTAARRERQESTRRWRMLARDQVARLIYMDGTDVLGTCLRLWDRLLIDRRLRESRLQHGEQHDRALRCWDAAQGRETRRVVFMSWKLRVGGTREKLQAKLRQAGLATQACRL